MHFANMFARSAISLLSLSILPSVTCSLTESCGVSRDILAELKLYSQYVSASYCSNNYNGTTTPTVTCPTGSCPEVQDSDATAFGSFFNIGNDSVSALLTVSHAHKKLVLAFPGAATTIAAETKLETAFLDCTAICSKCGCHSGYYNAWTTVRDRAVALVNAAKEQFPHYPLVVTGHSFGATIAVFAAAEFRNNGTATDLYTYGQPHVGDLIMSKYVSDQGNNYRVTHTDDPAPRFEDPSLGYRHITPEYWIYEDRNANFTVAPDQIKVIHGYNSSAGNEVRRDNFTNQENTY